MPKPISHVVRRPGPRPGDPDVEIPVAEDLVTVPGHPVREADISFYSREEPLEQWHMEKGADRDWAWTVYSDEFFDFRKAHENNRQAARCGIEGDGRHRADGRAG